MTIIHIRNDTEVCALLTAISTGASTITGVPPTVTEVATEMGWSRSKTHVRLLYLKEIGFISSVPRAQRTLVLTTEGSAWLSANC